MGQYGQKLILAAVGIAQVFCGLLQFILQTLAPGYILNCKKNQRRPVLRH